MIPSYCQPSLLSHYRSKQPVFDKWRKICSNSVGSSPDLTWRILNIWNSKLENVEKKKGQPAWDVNEGVYCDGNLDTSKPIFTAHKTCFFVSNLNAHCRTKIHGEKLWTHFHKAFLNLSDRRNSSLSLLRNNPRYHSLKCPLGKL